MTEISNFTEELSEVHRWGIEFIKSIQTIANPSLTEFTKIFTDVSTYGFFAFACVICMWCIDYKKGLYLGYLLSFGAGILEGLKAFLHIPRPYTHSPEIMLKKMSGFSTPSGHSFNAAMMYTATFFYDKKTKLKNSTRYLIVITMTLLIGLSRIYLGVHYPTDVLLGLALGLMSALIFIYFTPIIDKRVSNLSESMAKVSNKNIKSLKFAVAAVFSFIVIMVYKEKTYLAGLLFGLAFGNVYIFEALNLSFDAKDGSLIKKIIRVLLGVSLISIPMIVFSFLGITKAHTQFRLYNFLEYAIVGVIASGIAPMIFCKLKLCE